MRGEPEPAELLEDSQEAYFALHPAAGGGPVYASLLAVLALAAAMLPVLRVDVGTRARGLLRPALERHRVVAGVAGVVERVDTRLGARVRAGDPLLRLRDDAGVAALALLDSASEELELRMAELEALLPLAAALAEAPDVPPGPARAARPAAGRHLARWSARAAAQRERLRAEWTDLAREWEGARAEAARAEELSARGLAAPADVERARLRSAHARAAPGLLAARQRDAWAGELEQARARARELAGERARLLALARLADVRAPVAGTVEALAALSPGSRLGAAEELAVISPDAPLVAEAWLESREAGRVRPGMPVRLLVDAFDHHEWGYLPGRVAEVAQDYTVVAGRPGFRVRCLPLGSSLRRPDGRTARARKGMAVTVVFVLGRRTLFQLLRDRVTRASAQDAVAPAE